MSTISYFYIKSDFKTTKEQLIGVFESAYGRIFKWISERNQEHSTVGKLSVSSSLLQVDTRHNDEAAIPAGESSRERIFKRFVNAEDDSFDLPSEAETILSTGFPEGIADDEGFDFAHEVSEINRENSVINKDAELAGRFYKTVNPHTVLYGQILDGHCAICALNTHLHLIGQKLKEAPTPGTNDFKKQGDWFHKTFSSRFELDIIESGTNETYRSMRGRVEEKIKELTQPGEAVLVSVDFGTHWYNAYNDGTRVWFIDSQTGKGFNLYRTGKGEQLEDIIDMEDTDISIIRVTEEDISEYSSQFK